MGTVVIVAVSGVILVTVLLWALEFRPSPRISVPPLHRLGGTSPPSVNDDRVRAGDTLRLITWNIGFGSLDGENDSFTDGGRGSRGRSKDAVEENLRSVVTTIAGTTATDAATGDSPHWDAILLQEVDYPSTRSYRINQVQRFTDTFPRYPAYFAANHKSPFVPVPLRRPVGRVHSGVLTLLHKECPRTERIALPGVYPYPQRLFHLKRCVLLHRLPLDGGDRSLYLMNVHLSAFDPGGEFRRRQLEMIRTIALDLHNQGHYVVAGGDWNSTFPGVTRDLFAPWTSAEKHLQWIQPVPDDLFPQGWRWAWDRRNPTVRTNERPYRRGENFTTIIDGFLLSPNVDLVSVQTVETGFCHTDHQPVVVEVSLL